MSFIKINLNCANPYKIDAEIGDEERRIQKILSGDQYDDLKEVIDSLNFVVKSLLQKLEVQRDRIKKTKLKNPIERKALLHSFDIINSIMSSLISLNDYLLELSGCTTPEEINSLLNL